MSSNCFKLFTNNLTKRQTIYSLVSKETLLCSYEHKKGATNAVVSQ